MGFIKCNKLKHEKHHNESKYLWIDARTFYNHLLFFYKKTCFIYDNDNSLVSNPIKHNFVKRQ